VRELRQNQRCPANPVGAARGVAAYSRAGFTLIEMLISLTLMLILFTMMYGFGSPSHQRQQKLRCQQNLQKLYLAMQIYANDNHGDFPAAYPARNSAEVLDLLVPKYTSDTSIFICPGSKDSEIPAGESIRKRKISYAFYTGRRLSDGGEVLLSDKQINSESKAAGQPVFSADGKAPGNNHHKYGGNFLFCDGRIESSSNRAPFSLVLTQNVILLNP
jgi:prepilin-type N-terminal cleavage/methylation domain-containing protein